MKEIINQLASHNLLQDILEGVPIRIFWKDRDCRYLGCNILFAKDAGFSHPDELIGKSDFDMGWADQAELYRADDQKVIDSGEPILNFEEPQNTPEGKTIWLRTSKVPLYDESHQVIGILGIYEDTTVQKQTQAALERSEKQFRSIFNTLQDIYYSTDSDGNITMVSPSAATLMGCKTEDLLGKQITQYYIDERGREKFSVALQRGDGVVNNYDTEIRRFDGKVIWISTNAHYLFDKEGNVSGVEGTIRDISSQKQIESALHESELRFRDLFEKSPDPCWIINEENLFMLCNQAAADILGYDSIKELQATHPSKLSPEIQPDGRGSFEKANAMIAAAHKSGSHRFEWEHQRKSGECFPVEVTLAQIEIDAKKQLYCVWRDISERKQQQALLEASRARFQTLFESSTDGIFILNMQGRFIDINRTAHERLGYTKEEMMLMKLTELDPPEFAAKVPERIAQIHLQGMATFETAHYRKDGSIMPVEINARILELNGEKVFFSVIRDISERKQFEEQLRQAQKMEAIGTLVGGIAHDFNNMLAAIQGNIYLAKMQLQDHPIASDRLVNIEQLGIRAADMVQQLLTFARKDIVAMSVFSLNAFMKEGYKLAKAAIPENIDHQTTICQEELYIKGDATQLQQVLMNLLNNAVDAVAGTPQPSIRCNLTAFDADSAFRQKHPELTINRFACISVIDNGHGIHSEKFDKIFEPFFTTKEVGKGTGLGLAMLYGAVQTHGGTVEVESDVGKATSFHVYLPLNGSDVELMAETPAFTSAKHSGGILLVDDDDDVRQTTGEVLSCMGYQIFEAEDGEQALALFNLHRDEIMLIITDVIMPHMGGANLLKAIRKLDKTIPAILVTGYDKGNVLDMNNQIEHCRVITKPFQLDTLALCIEEFMQT